MLKLKVERGEPAGLEYPLGEGVHVLGRSSSAQCRLASPDISGQHARVTVKAGVATVENLSRFGTRLDDVEVRGTLPLAAGQRIAVGKSTVLAVVGSGAAAGGEEGMTQAVPGGAATRGTVAMPAPAGEAVTGKAPAAEDRTRALPATRGVVPAATRPGVDAKTRAVTGAEAGSDLTSVLSRPEEGGEASGEMTHAMQTRAASPEEIEFLRVTEQKRVKRRMTIGLLVGLPLLILVIVFRPRTPPPEIEFEWPKDKAGEYMDAFVPAPNGGAKEGGYDIGFPATPGYKKGKISGGLAIECAIGRDLNVPMRLYLQDETDKRFLGMDRKTLVEDWMTQAAASGGRWNFDKPAPAVSFIGKENGIPYVRVAYQRDAEGAWFGVATVIRHGARRIAVRAEAPANERVRAEKILSAKFLRPSADFERSYWEPPAEPPSGAEDVLLSQVRQDMDRMAPATWAEIETLLAAVLAKSTRNGNAEVETQGLQALMRLREREALWFNSQQLAFDAAVMQGNYKKAARIAEFSKAVFSNLEDQRYYTVRKWKVRE